MNNVLITSAGRRVELVNSFKRELNQLIDGSIVCAIDANPHLSAACQTADKSDRSPKVTDESYIDFLLRYCLLNNIGLVIPTIDTELEVLSIHKSMFKGHGINICVSDLGLIQRCSDKRLTGHLFNEHSIYYPEIYSIESIKFPCFIKPFNGSCSAGAKQISTASDLSADELADPELIFMELIGNEYAEYTIDAYYDKNSNLKCLVPRKRLEVRAGEVSKGVTIKNFVYNDILLKMNHLNGAIGCLTIQVFVNEVGKKYIGLEINPRFGGGFPLAYDAGANYPKWLVEEYILNKSISVSDDWEDNLLMLRYDAKVLVHDCTI